MNQTQPAAAAVLPTPPAALPPCRLASELLSVPGRWMRLGRQAVWGAEWDYDLASGRERQDVLAAAEAGRVFCPLRRLPAEGTEWLGVSLRVPMRVLPNKPPAKARAPKPVSARS